jgi:type I restriction enzyme S subunit
MTTPEAWTKVKLSQVADIGWGDLSITKKSYVESGYTAFSATGADGFLPYFDYDQDGIVVSAIGANCGKIWRAYGKWSCIKNTMRIIIKEAPVSLDYLYYFLSDPTVFPKRGSGQPFISKEDARDIEIAYPSIEEQRKIVELLEDHLSRLEAALADVKQAKFRATQFRRSLLQAGLNGFFNDGPKDEISGFPKTWRLKTLSEVADWTSGGTPSSKDSELYGGDIPWIVIGDLTEGIVLETEKKITQKGLDSSSAKKLPVGTVMVAMYGASIGRTGVMGKEMTTNQAIACGIPKSEEILGRYLLYFLQSQKNEFIAAGKGGAQPNISQGVVKSWRIPLPPLDEQLAIINEIDGQLEHLLQANRATESLLKESTGLRRSLLQAAFTGQLTKEVVNV